MDSFDTKMTALADSIRNKSGETNSLSLDGMKEAVDSIQSGSVETYVGEVSATIMPDLGALTFVYTDKNLNIQTVKGPATRQFNFEVVKNSIVFINGGNCIAKSGCEKLGGSAGSYAYKITSNSFSIVHEA